MGLLRLLLPESCLLRLQAIPGLLGLLLPETCGLRLLEARLLGLLSKTCGLRLREARLLGLELLLLIPCGLGLLELLLLWLLLLEARRLLLHRETCVLGLQRWLAEPGGLRSKRAWLLLRLLLSGLGTERAAELLGHAGPL